MLRWLTAGESHGPSLVAILEGLPAHVRVTTDDLADALARRRLGYGRGARMKFEQDEVALLGGVRHGETQGGPVAIEVGNTEWPKWEKVMSADPVDPAELDALARNAPLTRPRPGHADLVGHAEVRLRRGPPDPRARLGPRDRGPGGARAGWRRNFLEQAVGATDRLPRRRARRRAARPRASCPRPDDVARLDADPVRCLDPEASAAMVAAIDQAHKDGDTLGGVVEVVVARPAAGPRLPRPLGPPPRLAARRRADGHPGDQGRRGRRRLRARRHPRLAGARRDRADRRRAAPRLAVAPAAPRAA